MLLIADSGSTKTDWRLVDEDGQTISYIQSKGINPYFLTEKEIASTIQQEVAPKAGLVDRVLYYGSGCANPLKANQVKSALLEVFPGPFPPEVFGDMLGAARSLLQDQSGIACILGTGANSCVYDGVDIIDNVPSLGYILADWGSGAVLGKDLISLILRKKMPKEILEDFNLMYQLDLRQILDNLYNKPRANTFLASFTPFMLKHVKDPSCQNIILRNFKQFFEFYVCRYVQYKSGMPVNFVGSIAYYFSDLLEISASELGISIGEIVKNPMEGLIKYHFRT